MKRIIALSVSGILILSIVVLLVIGFVVEVEYTTSFDMPNKIVVNNLVNADRIADEGNLNQNQIVEILNSKTTQKYIIALFSGNLDKKTFISKTILSSFENTNGFDITLIYDVPQTLKFIDYSYVDSSNTTLTELEYTKIKFSLSDSNELQFVTFHIMTEDDKYEYKINQFCNLNALYNYLLNIPNFANSSNN